MLLLDLKKLIVANINLLNSTSYTLDQAEFGLPYTVAELPSGTATYANTSVRVRFETKEYVYSYNRVMLSATFMQFPYQTKSLLKLCSVTGDVRASIALSLVKHYGYPMDAEDIAPGSVKIAGNLLIFSISKNSYRYLSEVLTFTLDGQYVYTGDEIYRVYEPTATVDPDWWREHLDNGVAQGQVNLATTPRLQFLTHPVDYSPIADYLRGFIGISDWSKGRDAIPEYVWCELASRLSSVDGLPWIGGVTDVIGTRVSLNRPWIVYNGPTSNCKKDGNMSYLVPTEQIRVMDAIDHSFDCVAILRILSSYPAYVNNISNKANTHTCLILHYNLPKD